jgi:hypothetical protein
MKILRSDFAKPLMAKASTGYLEEKEIASQSSKPYQHFQNSVEIDIYTITKHLLSFTDSCGFDPTHVLWRSASWTSTASFQGLEKGLALSIS